MMNNTPMTIGEHQVQKLRIEALKRSVVGELVKDQIDQKMKYFQTFLRNFQTAGVVWGLKSVPQVDATADTMHPPENPANTSHMDNPEILERATNQLGSSILVQDIVSSYTTETMVSSASDTKTELVIGLSSTNVPIKFYQMMSQSLPVKLQRKKKTDESKSPEMDGKISEPLRVVGIKSKKEQSGRLGPKMSNHDISPEVESVEHIEIVDSVQFIADSAQDRDVGSRGCLVQVCDTNGDGNEDMHVLSIANDLPIEDISNSV
ncbi:hypothetical protein F0562_007926 [Nyssa sinensis]|uniref:Uncharacterized protein n=1 Tax=Nyssa sinensis TaxID=561372 RepID=A0A5J5A4E3_9ASTE|nr:hypothetical protein F0562_007926 [Nyssa sinensis]